MGNGVFNVSKGRVNEYVYRVNNNDPANSALIVVLLASSGLVADATMADYATLSAVLAGASDEATNTGYARKTITDSGLTDPTVDNTNDWAYSIVGDQSWTLSNDGTGAIGKLLVCYDSDTTGGTDANIIPCTYHDFVVTPDGSVVTADESSDGFYRAA